MFPLHYDALVRAKRSCEPDSQPMYIGFALSTKLFEAPSSLRDQQRLVCALTTAPRGVKPEAGARFLGSLEQQIFQTAIAAQFCGT